MRLDPEYLAMCLAPAMTSIVVALCMTKAISYHFWRRKHLVADDENRDIRRAFLRRRKHVLISAIWGSTLLGIVIMAIYFHP